MILKTDIRGPRNKRYSFKNIIQSSNIPLRLDEKTIKYEKQNFCEECGNKVVRRDILLYPSPQNNTHSK